jgi:hypothetical protein
MIDEVKKSIRSMQEDMREDIIAMNKELENKI